VRKQSRFGKIDNPEGWQDLGFNQKVAPPGQQIFLQDLRYKPLAVVYYRNLSFPAARLVPYPVKNCIDEKSGLLNITERENTHENSFTQRYPR
jgi:hypothetical protein